MTGHDTFLTKRARPLLTAAFLMVAIVESNRDISMLPFRPNAIERPARQVF